MLIESDFPWIRTDYLGSGVWAFDDNREDVAYLVTGKERALLIDTGLGVADLADSVKQVTRLPLLVVNTHGHPDHAGGDFQFGEAYVSEKDFDMVHQLYHDAGQREEALKFAINQHPYPDYFSFTEWKEPKEIKLHPVQEGDAFDLGGRSLEVIEVPGHTAGCIALIDYGSRMLFSGDTVSTEHIFMHIGGTTPFETYRKSLFKLKERIPYIDFIYPSHGKHPIDPGYVSELCECADRILQNPSSGLLCHTMGGDGMMQKYGRGYIIYNPSNLS